MRELLLIFLLTPSLLFAQAFRQDINSVSSDEILFNPAFVQAQKITQVTIEFSRKRENERIENLQHKSEYTFNENGLVTGLLKVDHPLFVNPDSTLIRFYYSPEGLLKIKRTIHKGIYRGEYFEYDSLKNLVKVVVTEEDNLTMSTVPDDFKPAHQKIIFLETYKYEKLSPEQTRISIMNDNGTVYKQGIIYTESGYVREKDLRFMITGIRVNEKFTYDEKKRISSYQYFTDAAGDLEEKKVYTYETNENLKMTEYFKNGELLNQTHHFYDKKSLFPDGDVNKEMKTGVLFLTSYKYKFRDQPVTEPLPGKKFLR